METIALALLAFGVASFAFYANHARGAEDADRLRRSSVAVGIAAAAFVAGFSWFSGGARDAPQAPRWLGGGAPDAVLGRSAYRMHGVYQPPEARV